MTQYTKNSWSDFRLGLISLLTVTILIAGLVFAGGNKGLLFKQTVLLNALLPDVGGLKRGCAVTMAGMTVGKVNRVDFASKDPAKPIEVLMEVRSDLRKRIKTDSVPTVRTQGMLGDRYIDISVGSTESPELPAGGILKGKPASDFDLTLHETHKVLNETQKLLSAVNAKEGTMGQMIYNAQLYDTLVHVTEDLNDLVRDLKANPKKYLKFSVF